MHILKTKTETNLININSRSNKQSILGFHPYNISGTPDLKYYNIKGNIYIIIYIVCVTVI